MKSSNGKCALCENHYHRYEEDSIAYHSFKVSNGVDYDNHIVPCAVQSTKGMSRYRRQSLTFVTAKVIALRAKLALAESKLQAIKTAKTPGKITEELEKVKYLL
jgi:hypothetical protein